jgi:hypothetical protein
MSVSTTGLTAPVLAQPSAKTRTANAPTNLINLCIAIFFSFRQNFAANQACKCIFMNIIE